MDNRVEITEWSLPSEAYRLELIQWSLPTGAYQVKLPTPNGAVQYRVELTEWNGTYRVELPDWSLPSKAYRVELTQRSLTKGA